MRAVDTFFLVIKANSKLLQLKEVFAIDEAGKSIAPLHSVMSTFFPGWGTFNCHDQNNYTHCSTRLGDRDPWLEIEYSLENGIGQVGLINDGTRWTRATILIYKDVYRQKLLWEGRFTGKSNVEFWDGKYPFFSLL